MTTMLEKMAARLAEELGEGERPDGLTRVEGVFDMREVARAALLAIREPSVAAHNVGAFSDHQSKPPMIVSGEDGLLRIEWRPANPRGMFTAMIDAILAEPETT